MSDNILIPTDSEEKELNIIVRTLAIVIVNNCRDFINKIYNVIKNDGDLHKYLFGNSPTNKPILTLKHVKRLYSKNVQLPKTIANDAVEKKIISTGYYVILYITYFYYFHTLSRISFSHITNRDEKAVNLLNITDSKYPFFYFPIKKNILSPEHIESAEESQKLTYLNQVNVLPPNILDKMAAEFGADTPILEVSHSVITNNLNEHFKDTVTTVLINEFEFMKTTLKGKFKGITEKYLLDKWNDNVRDGFSKLSSDLLGHNLSHPKPKVDAGDEEMLTAVFDHPEKNKDTLKNFIRLVKIELAFSVLNSFKLLEYSSILQKPISYLLKDMVSLRSYVGYAELANVSDLEFKAPLSFDIPEVKILGVLILLEYYKEFYFPIIKAPVRFYAKTNFDAHEDLSGHAVQYANKNILGALKTLKSPPIEVIQMYLTKKSENFYESEEEKTSKEFTIKDILNSIHDSEDLGFIKNTDYRALSNDISAFKKYVDLLLDHRTESNPDSSSSQDSEDPFYKEVSNDFNNLISNSVLQEEINGGSELFSIDNVVAEIMINVYLNSENSGLFWENNSVFKDDKSSLNRFFRSIDSDKNKEKLEKITSELKTEYPEEFRYVKNLIENGKNGSSAQNSEKSPDELKEPSDVNKVLNSSITRTAAFKFFDSLPDSVYFDEVYKELKKESSSEFILKDFLNSKLFTKKYNSRIEELLTPSEFSTMSGVKVPELNNNFHLKYDNKEENRSAHEKKKKARTVTVHDFKVIEDSQSKYMVRAIIKSSSVELNSLHLGVLEPEISKFFILNGDSNSERNRALEAVKEFLSNVVKASHPLKHGVFPPESISLNNCSIYVSDNYSDLSSGTLSTDDLENIPMLRDDVSGQHALLVSDVVVYSCLRASLPVLKKLEKEKAQKLSTKLSGEDSMNESIKTLLSLHTVDEFNKKKTLNEFSHFLEKGVLVNLKVYGTFIE
jgi:hypothetical protein